MSPRDGLCLGFSAQPCAFIAASSLGSGGNVAVDEEEIRTDRGITSYVPINAETLTWAWRFRQKSFRPHLTAQSSLSVSHVIFLRPSS